jgi:hypothetical protein
MNVKREIRRTFSSMMVVSAVKIEIFQEPARLSSSPWGRKKEQKE